MQPYRHDTFGVASCVRPLTFATLFNLYLEELIARFRISGNGVKIGYKRLGYLAYADYVLMTESKEEVEKLLRIADTFRKELNIKYTTRKYKVVEFGEKEENQWVLGSYILEVIDSYTYLGLEVNKEGIREEKQRSMNKGKARMMTGSVEQ